MVEKVEVVAHEMLVVLVVAGVVTVVVVVGQPGNSVVWLWFFVFVVVCSALLAVKLQERAELQSPEMQAAVQFCNEL